MSETRTCLFWEGAFAVCHSFAAINRACAGRLAEDADFDLTLVQTEPPQPGFLPAGLPDLLKHDLRRKPPRLKQLRSQQPIWVSHRWPPRKTAPPHRAHWITQMPWEFSRLPIEIAAALNQADEIWTPSGFCRRAFVRSGIPEEKIVVIPNGIDPEVFRMDPPGSPPFPLHTEKSFRFLFVGGTIHRKGIDLLLEAFGTVFSAGEDVSLVIKEMGHPTLYRDQSARDRIAAMQAEPDSPEILYLTEPLSDEEMSALYRACDVVVLPYRGEGFCLPALEAAACGIPSIITEGGPTDEFLPAGASWGIRSILRNLGTSIYGNPCDGDVHFLEPDRSSLAECLRAVFESSAEERTQMGKRAAAVRETHDWNNIVGLVRERLFRVSSHP